MSDSVFLTNGNGSITGLVDTSYAGELVIPEYVNGEKITSIGIGAFSECTNLTSITIPNSVTNIGEGAFYYCESLTFIIIPDSVTSIGLSAFMNCFNLTSITIPNSVTSIDAGAFYNCTNLTSIYVDDPNNLSSAVSSYDWSGTNSSGVTFVQNPRVIEYLIKGGTLIDIADKIRVLNGTEETLTLAEMQSELDTFNSEVTQLMLEQDNFISQIATTLESKTVVTPNVQPLRVTESGIYEAPSGVDGYSPVTVDVQSGVNLGEYEVVGIFPNEAQLYILNSRLTQASISTCFPTYSSFYEIGDIFIPLYLYGAEGPMCVGLSTTSQVLFISNGNIGFSPNEGEFLVLRASII